MMRYTRNGILGLVAMLIAATSVAADDVDDLVAAITGDDNEARMNAASHAGSIGAPALEPLGVLASSDEYLVARAARLALQRIVAAAGVPGADPDGEVPKALLKLAQPGQPAPTRREAIHYLGWIGGPDNVAAIAELLTDPDIGDSARMALQRIPGADVAEALLAAAPQVDDAVQPGIFYALALIGAQDAIPLLKEITKGEDQERSWMAFDVLTRMGVAPLEIIPRTHAKELADRKRYASGFLRAADTLLARGEKREAERMYTAVAAFPITPQHGGAALIGLKNTQSPKLIEHALGHLLENDIRDVAESTLTEADIEGLDDYLIRAYAVTNPAKQRVILKVLAARSPEGIERFLNEARHNESAMVRFTAARVLGDVPAPDAFEAAVASAPPYEKREMANTYFDMAVTEQRGGRLDAARDMAQALINEDFEPRIREGAFNMIETIASPASAPVLRELIGAAYQPSEDSEPAEDLFEGIRSLTIAAGRAYVAVLAALAKTDPAAIEEIVKVSENAFNAEVSNFADEKLKELGAVPEQVSKLESAVWHSGYLN